MNAQSLASSALYVGRVMHARLSPVAHRFTYRVFWLLMDLDELPRLDRRLKLFAHNRPAPIAFYDRDHGAFAGALKDWVRAQLADAGLCFALGRVQLLAMPRILGYGFNPLSIFYCHDADGVLRAIIYEVHSTFSQSHSYITPVERAEGDPLIRCETEKEFYVSPFIDLATRYAFRLTEPKARLALAIDESRDGVPFLKATLSAERRPLTDLGLLRVFFTHPLVTLKIIVGIHFEAFRLWRKKVTFVHNPKMPSGRFTRAKAVTGARQPAEPRHAEREIHHRRA